MKREILIPCKELITTDYLHHSNDYQELPNQFYKSGDFAPVIDEHFITPEKRHLIPWYIQPKYMMAKGRDSWCVWHTDTIADGNYDVYVWFPSVTEATTAGAYTILTPQGTKTVTINQREHLEQWVLLLKGCPLTAEINGVHLRNETEDTLSVGTVKYIESEESEPDFVPYPAFHALIREITPTVCFYHPENAPEELLQLVQVTLENFSIPQPVTLQVRFSNRVVAEKRIPAFCGIREVEIGIPDIAHETEGVFTLIHENNLMFEQTMLLKPTPKYTVYMQEAYHNDLGYEHSVPYKAEYWADWMDDAIALIEEHTYPDHPEQNYNFWFEHLWQFLMYTKVRTKGQIEKVKKLFEEKRLHTACQHTSSHGQWGGIEQTARVPYYLKQQVKNQLGIDSKGILCNFDNPTFAWDSVRDAYQAGFQGVLLSCSGWKGPHQYIDAIRKNKMSDVFYWQLPNGKDKIPAYITNSYGVGMNFHYSYSCNQIFNNRLVDKNIKRYVQDCHPYDIVLDMNYYDNEKPNLNMYSFLKSHNARFAYPVFLHNHPLEEYFEAVFAKYGETGDNTIPTYSGEINNFSGDYSSINVNARREKVQATHLTRTAEVFSAAAAVKNQNFQYPKEQIYEQYWKFNEFDEHCYPTGPEYGDFQYYSTLYYKSKGVNSFMLPAAKEMTAAALTALNEKITVPEEDIWVVYNPLAFTRSDLVYLEAERTGSGEPAVLDLETGKLLPAQWTMDGKLVFYAEKLPSVGYRSYRILQMEKPVETAASFWNNQLENAYYTITFDQTTGDICSIIDRSLGKELVEPEKRINQYRFRIYTPGQSNHYEEFTPLKGTVELVEQGAVRTVVKMTAEEKRSDAGIVQYVTLYHHCKRIDFKNDLSHVDAMYEPFTADYFSNMDMRYRNNLFYAFPFAVENHQFEICTTGGVVMDPFGKKDAIWDKLAIKDYNLIDNWVHIKNEEIGITLFSPDAPCAMMSEISYNNFSATKENKSSAVYSYFQSARIGPNGFLGSWEANFTVSYSITSGVSGFQNQNSVEQGLSLTNPLLAVKQPAKHTGDLPIAGSFLQVSHKNIQLSVVKQSEEPGRGLVVRFYEAEGKAVEDAHFTSKFFPVKRAYLVDLAENNEQEISILGEKIPISIAPYEMVTVRLVGVSTVAESPVLSATAVNDGRVALTWTEAPGSAGYRIYRDVQADFTPNAYNLVGRTSELTYLDLGQTPFTRFQDSGFAPGKTFYYRVEPVTAENNKGMLSNEATATLAKKNDSPPNPVRGLMAMQLENIGDNYRVAVQWEKGADEDVTAFRIYRSEEADFIPNPVNRVTPFVVLQEFHGSYMEVFTDHFMIEPGKTYFYKVCPVDCAGNEQLSSPIAEVTVMKLT